MKINIKKITGENISVKCDSFSIITYNKNKKSVKEIYSGGEIEKVSVISEDINKNISLHDCKAKYVTLLEILDIADEVHTWMVIDINNSNAEFINKVNMDIREYIIKALCQR